jgi:membrane-associated protease RseP (regulator of RpoE activity)
MKKFISLIVIAALGAAAIHASENFGGLGISVYAGKSGASVASVLPNSPASQIGLLAGDMIISVNGVSLSSVAPEKQISMLRGSAGSSVNLLVHRNGESMSLYAKRADISVQKVSALLGKSENIALEDINYLASQKVGEGYEFLGVMQNGLLVDSDMENLNSQLMEYVSLKKETAKEYGAASVPSAKAIVMNSANRGTISFSLANATSVAKILIFNSKGATVWQKNLGALPPGASNVEWEGASLPAGSYHARLELGGTTLFSKFELR